jgi:hypothetical protein
MSKIAKVVLPPLSIDMRAIRTATTVLKDAKEAEKWSKKQEATANAAYAVSQKLGKALPVNSPDTVWNRSPVQPTMEENAKSHSDENKKLYNNQKTNGLTIDGGKRKSRKSKKTRKSRKHKKSKKSKKN